MALFGKTRDIQLFHKLNDELLKSDMSRDPPNNAIIFFLKFLV